MLLFKEFIYVHKVFSLAIAAVSVLVIALLNSHPILISQTYSLSDGSLTLTPNNRVITHQDGSESTYEQTGDLIYFTTPYTQTYDTAELVVSYKNEVPEQFLKLGYQDRSDWHYALKVLDAPLLRSSEWLHYVGNAVLYLRTLTHVSVTDFIQNIPEGTTVGLLDFTLSPSSVNIPNYTPSKRITTIDTPLRGAHVFYVYLKDEPFSMTISKQDLNWYEDPDPATITISKENDVVYSAVIADDGDASASHEPGLEQQITLKNPGTELPEAGVYKVTIDATSDSVITRITTPLQKLVFQSPIFPIANREAYPQIVQKTSTTTLFSNAASLGITSHHKNTLQSVTVNGSSSPLLTLASTSLFYSSSTKTVLELPKSDVTISGSGYFAFTEDAFFLPFPYNTLPLAPHTSLDGLSYVLSPYEPATQNPNDKFYTAKRIYFLTDAAPRGNKLSWMLAAPSLSESNASVWYKDIVLTYSTKGWLSKWYEQHN